MRCAICQCDNAPSAKFCQECGNKFPRTCSACGTGLDGSAKFCPECGAAVTGTVPAAEHQPRRIADYTPRHLAEKILQSRAALEGERKEVTVLFADVKGSMGLAGQLDPEVWHEVLDRYFEILTEGVHRFEGTVNQYTGDGIMALFGAPIAHEDHAQRACHAALHLRDRLATYAQRLQVEYGIDFAVRMGLNSGEVVVGRIGDDLRMDYTAQGAIVGLAQRIEQLAGSGSAWLSEHTARRVEGYFELMDLGTATLAGIATGVRVFELVAAGNAQTRLEVARTRGLSGFVGRTGETRTLESALDRARDGYGQVIGVVGEPGIGKSRLCLEFIERCRAQGIAVYEAHCLAHGRNIPFAPILELFRDYFGITAFDGPVQARGKVVQALGMLGPALDGVLPILFDFMGVEEQGQPALNLDADGRQRRLFALFRDLYRIQTEQGIVAVLSIDDVHWIDPASDAFLAQMVAATVDCSRNLLLLNFRPEYQAPWMRRAHYQQLPLMPLAGDAVAVLLNELLGRDASLGDLASRIVRWAGGNPFYTEEIVRELVEAGYLKRTGETYRLVTSPESLPVPANVKAVLAARIDRLDEYAKLVLQAAAVIGRDFDEPILRRVVASLLPSVAAPGFDGALRTLSEGEFIYMKAARPAHVYSFRHPLTHEVALASQLRDKRAKTHAAIARVQEEVCGDRLDEFAALLAHHHESAGNHSAAALWHRRAAEWAGLKDVAAALRHWQKVRELVRQNDHDAESTALMVMSCTQALAHGWRLGASASHWAELFEEGCAAAERAGDFASLARLHASYSIERALNQGIAPDYVRYSASAVRLADRHGERSLRCGTRACLVLALGYAGNLTEAERVADEVIEIAAGGMDLGVDVTGFSALLTAIFARHRAIGFMRDPDAALRELPRVHQLALDSGYPEQALWILYADAEMKYHSGRTHGARALAQAATRLMAHLGVGNELMAAMAVCAALACEADWPALRDAADEALRLLRERGALRLVEAIFLAYAGLARIELGDVAGGRASAAEGVNFIRASECRINPYSYAVFARAQLLQDEPADDIARTLDEYAAVIAASGFNLFEGELHELRARLLGREGRHAERTAALDRGRACYARFGMTAYLARLNSLK